jgi:hypothetical protein
MDDFSLDLKQELRDIVDDKITRLFCLIENEDTKPIQVAYVLYNTVNEICTLLKLYNITDSKGEEEKLKEVFSVVFYSGIYVIASELMFNNCDKDVTEKVKEEFVKLCEMNEDIRDELDYIFNTDNEDDILKD